MTTFLECQRAIMHEDLVRVVRVLEYIGPRKEIERNLEHALTGSKTFGEDCMIREFSRSAPQVISAAQPKGQRYVVS